MATLKGVAIGIKNWSIALSIVGGVATGAIYGLNWTVNSGEWNGYSNISIERPDGPFSYTEIEQDKDSKKKTTVKKRNWCINRDQDIYVDGGYYGDHDGLVDRIIEKRGDKETRYEREINFHEYPDKFDRADQELKRTKQRFKSKLRYD